MQTRFIDQVGQEISLLGFGCMRLPRLNKDTQDIDYSLGQAMVDRAIAAGVNYFDTAYLYHDGLSEPFIGQALKKYPRDSFCLATKMPTWSYIKTPEDVERIFADQLEKCRVDYFDFYLAHCLTKDHFLRFREIGVYEILQKKKQEGKIRRLGFSFHDSPPVLEEIVSAYAWDFGQIQLNYMDWDDIDAKRQYEILRSRNIPVIIMEPVRGGSLAALNEEAVNILKSADPGASLASWALRYAASLPGVITVLSGMSLPDQVEDNLNTFSPLRELSGDERETIARAAAAFRTSGSIACTGCRYCMDCPSGVNIPEIFAVFNRYCSTGNRDGAIKEYRGLKDGEKAHNCTKCNICTEKCPQGLKIPSLMERMVYFAAGN